MLKVYSTPNCTHCVSAKRWLGAAGIAFTVIDVTTDSEALSFLKRRGHNKVPQLYLGETLVATGFDGLRALGEAGLREVLASAAEPT